MIVRGSLITNKEEVLAEWERHVQKLSTSQSEAIPQIAEATKKLSELKFLSRLNSDQVLDDEIVMEEIEGVIKRIKQGKRAGRDNICAKHLLYGGELLKVWLKQMFNTIISFEEIPNCLKTSLTKPIYNGRGKDPLEASSFRGVALSSTIAKLPEYIILERMRPILLEFNSLTFSRLPTSEEFLVKMPSLQPKKQP